MSSSKPDANGIEQRRQERRQSRVAEFNQLSKSPASYGRQQRRSSSARDAPTHSENSIVNTYGVQKDPFSAESPKLSPDVGPSRAGSQVSLSSMVRTKALESGGGDTRKVSDKVPFPGGGGGSVTFEHSASENEDSDTGAKRNRAATLDVPGLTRSKISPDGRIAKADVASKLVVVMVGLPARGKSYITKKLSRYLNWQQHYCRIFNVGNTRRRASNRLGPSLEPVSMPQNFKTSHSGDFFSPDNPDTVKLREKWAEDTLEELLDYILEGEGSVGILDATNTTVARRQSVMDIINRRSKGQLKVLFLESICNQRDIIEANVRLKLSGPDYGHMDRTEAINDFLQRLKNYEKAYQPITPAEEANRKFQYVKLINVGQKYECGNIKGFLSGQVVFFLLNFNLAPCQIWITRHGESTDNQLGKIGGDADLTERGEKYSKALTEFIKFKQQEFQTRRLKEEADKQEILKNSGFTSLTDETGAIEQNFCVWTSMLRRTIETAQYFSDNEFDVKEFRMLNELDPGICDGMTYEEIKEKYPGEYEARMKDKIRYRYPGIGGESYLDVINRLRPIIMEIERMEDNCLVICHRVVARVLLSYFMNLGRDAIGDLEVPLHTLYVLEPKPYGVDWGLYKYNERFNWFYKVSHEDAQVQSQLNDKKRRYTVVPTAGLSLGIDTETLKRTHDPGRPPSSAIADSSSEDESGDITTESDTSSNPSNSDPSSSNPSRAHSRRGSRGTTPGVSHLNLNE